MKNTIEKIDTLLEETFSKLNELVESDRDPGLTPEERLNVARRAEAAKKAEENRALSDNEIEKASKEYHSTEPEMGNGNPDLDGLTPNPHIPAGLLKAAGNIFGTNDN